MAMQDYKLRESLQSATDGDAGPGLSYAPFIVMEELLDKLKLLNYEQEFVKLLKMKPLNRHYFAIATNPGEQFYMFTSLAAWLLRKTGQPFEQPQEFDDPNSTIASIVDATRRLGAAVDFPPSKLKQGWGNQALFVLDCLADAALKSTNFTWHKPEPPVDVDEEADDEVEDAELLLERVEEEMAAELDDDDEDTWLNIDSITNMNQTNGMGQKPEEILESTTDSEQWKLELERVLPQLKVTIKTDARDWRAHLEQMQRHRSGIDEALGTTRGHLDRLHVEVARTLDKVGSREKYLNSQLEPHLEQYRSLHEELSRVTAQYREASGGVAERTRVLAQVTEQLESVKSELEERGSSMTDGTPLVNIKKALTQLRSEITAMDLRIGVLEHGLLQARLRGKSQLQQEMNVGLA